MIMHKRVRLIKGKLEMIDPVYSAPYTKANGWTDVRLIFIPFSAHKKVKFIKEMYGTVKTIGTKERDFNFFTNASYVNTPTGTILGKTIADGKVIAPDVSGKTEKRYQLVFRGNKPNIERVDNPEGIQSATLGSPLLVWDGRDVHKDQIIIEKTPSDIADGVNPRTAVGINFEKEFVLWLYVDGRGSVDRGLTQEECAKIFLHYGCEKALGKDGGGSSNFYTRDEKIRKALNIKDRDHHNCDIGEKHKLRQISHALAFDLDVDKVLTFDPMKEAKPVPVPSVPTKKPPYKRFPVYTVDEFINLLETYRGKVKFPEIHFHGTWKPTIADYNAKPFEKKEQIIESMWRHHTQTNGWKDIAQHVTITPDGLIWGGRSLLSPPASATGYNDSDDDRIHPFMFEVVGNFDKGQEELVGEQLNTTLKLIDAIMRIWGLPETALKFHREMTSAKTCPGSGINKVDILKLLKLIKEDKPVKALPKVDGYAKNVEVNGVKMQEAVVIDGYTYVKLREVGSAIDGSVISWDGVTARLDTPKP